MNLKKNYLNMENNEESKYSFHFGPNVLFLEFHDVIHFNTVKDAYEEVMLSFPNTKIKVIAYKAILGYWTAFEIETGNPIYCGTMSLKTTREQINKYLCQIK